MFTFMQAIEKLPASVVSGPLSDPEKLRSILKHHMVHGKYCLTTIVSVQVSLLRAAECIISQIINCADSIVLSWAFPASANKRIWSSVASVAFRHVCLKVVSSSQRTRQKRQKGN